MKVQEQLEFITQHAEYLTERELKDVLRVYLSAKNNLKTREEKDEMISYLLHSNINLVSKKMRLYSLQDLLYQYSTEKGIKNSLLSISELSSLINADVKQIDDNIFDNNESIEGVREMLKEKG